MATETLNLNNADCIVTKSHFGYDTIHNICAGSATNVDWTFVDYGLTAFLTILLVMFVIVFAGLVKALLEY